MFEYDDENNESTCKNNSILKSGYWRGFMKRHKNEIFVQKRRKFIFKGHSG